MSSPRPRSVAQRAVAALLLAVVMVAGVGCATAPGSPANATDDVLAVDAGPTASVFDLNAGRVRWSDVMPWVVIGVIAVVLILVISAI